ncbi:MAG: class I SAM-dependent methyltransferase [Anaerolineae bacterium]|nr:class I SAM-dependent methyltransferase [Anaerolineae bacterium]
MSTGRWRGLGRGIQRARKVLSYFRLQTPRDAVLVTQFLGLTLWETARLRLRNRRTVTCPCCGWVGNIFFPVYWVEQVERNSRCPRCYSEQRHRLVLRYLRDRLGLLDGPPPKRVLHVSPERGIQVALKATPGVGYVAVDLTADPLAAATDARMDITALALAGQAFDAIICNHVLEHIPDDRQAMAELQRVLKNGGYAIVMVPIMDIPQTIEYGRADPREWGHVRRYGRDYVRRLLDSGFQVTVDAYAYELPDEVVARESLFREPIFVVRKGPQHPPGVVGALPDRLPWQPDRIDT